MVLMDKTGFLKTPFKIFSSFLHTVFTVHTRVNEVKFGTYLILFVIILVLIHSSQLVILHMESHHTPWLLTHTFLIWHDIISNDSEMKSNVQCSLKAE